MKQKIAKICEELCCKNLSMDEQLVITGLLDSFKIMELICSLESEFHIRYAPDEISDLNNFSCIDSITSLVEKKISDKSGLL